MRPLDVTCAVLVVIGALNWGLVGAANFDLVATLFGPMSRVVYLLVGVAGVYQGLGWKAIQRRWALA